LEYLGAKYVEVPAECPVKYFNEDIKEVKKKCVSTNLPLINDNGFFVTEPIAIVKYLCRKYGRADLLGETIIDEFKIDEMFSRFVPHRNKMCDKFNTHVKGEDSPMTK
jgi:glutathione S-transferase